MRKGVQRYHLWHGVGMALALALAVAVALTMAVVLAVVLAVASTGSSVRSGSDTAVAATMAGAKGNMHMTRPW